MVKIKIDLEESYPFLETRVSSTPLIGYRAFNYSEDKITSVIKNYHWEGPIQRNKYPPAIMWVSMLNAQIQSESNEEVSYFSYDEAKERVGFFVYKTPTLTLLHLSSSYPIYGRLSLFGTVIEHELGFRAQFVRVDKLFVRPLINSYNKIEKIEDIYQCDVEVTRKMRDSLDKDYLEQLKTIGL